MSNIFDHAEFVNRVNAKFERQIDFSFAIRKQIQIEDTWKDYVKEHGTEPPDDIVDKWKEEPLNIYKYKNPTKELVNTWFNQGVEPKKYIRQICVVLDCDLEDLYLNIEYEAKFKKRANAKFVNALEGHSINPAFLEFVTKVPGVADAFPFSDRVLETYPGYYITHGDRERGKDYYFLESDDFSFIGADGTKRPLQGPDLQVVEEIQREVEDLIRLRLQQMKTTREREICDRIHEIEAASHRHVDKIKVSVDDAVNLAHPYQKAEALAEAYKKKNPSNEGTEESLQLLFDKYHISPRAVLETTSSETVKEYCRQYIEEHDGITEDQARRFDATLSLDGFPQSCVLPD